MKEIYFCVDELTAYLRANDEFTGTLVNCKGYRETDKALEIKFDRIVTTSMAHFSFDLISQGYNIYLCHKDRIIKIEPHMDLSGIDEPCKDLRFGHNILKLFMAGIFNELLYN